MLKAFVNTNIKAYVHTCVFLGLPSAHGMYKIAGIFLGKAE